MGPLVENILKINTTDHLQIQWQIRKILQDLGFEAKTEKKLLFGNEKKGKIDVYGEKDDYKVGVEVDHSVIRKKSVEKKIWPKYFALVKSGKKKFELRLADFKIKEDDILVLREWSP